MSAISVGKSPRGLGEVSLVQLHLLRALYFIWGLGLAFRIWPRFFPVDLSLPVMNTVVNSVLAGLSLVAFLGVRYPLKLLPLMFFEMAWKAVWLVAIGLPLWRAGPLDAPTVEVFKAILTLVVFPFLTPWRYAFDTYVKAPGDPWK
jgi:hypothetical protein